MRIFVAGAQGQVARGLLDAAINAGIDAVAAGRPELELSNAATVAAVITRLAPDVVINAAAYTKVDRAEHDEANAFAVNAGGAAMLARVCAERNIPLIHLSTDYVFDGAQDRPYRETDPTAPINAYGRSKLEGERQVAALCAKHLIVRTSWVFSPYGSNFLLTMLRLAAAKAALEVVDDQVGAPTYAPHLAQALILLAQRAVAAPQATPWGVYHAAGGGETSWFGFAREIFAEAALYGLPSAAVASITTANYPTPAKRPRNSRLDCDKLRMAFGVALPHWRSGSQCCLARVAAGDAPVGAGIVRVGERLA